MLQRRAKTRGVRVWKLFASRVGLLAAGVVAILLAAGGALAAAGDLDPTFGTGGTVTTAIGPEAESADAVEVQPDGRLVATGFSYNGTDNDFALVRYNSDGSLDTSFGGTGKVTTAIGGSTDQAHGLALQADGKIVVAGESEGDTANPGFDIALARYNSDGTLDPSFGGDGKVVTQLGSGPNGSAAAAVAVQSNGMIVAAGYSDNGASASEQNLDIALVRYKPDGSLDRSFRGGKVNTAIGSGDDRAFAVAVQPDGRIVAAGTTDNGSNLDFALVRYMPHGSLDRRFGGDGIVTTPIRESGDGAFAMTIQPDGRIIAAGYSEAASGFNRDVALARYMADGSLDPAFGDGTGKLTTSISTQRDQAFGVELDTDGRIVVGGSAFTDSNDDFAVVRYTSAGSLDTSFGGDGIVTTPIGPFADNADGLALQADGRIVLVGGTFNGSDVDFALARYEG